MASRIVCIWWQYWRDYSPVGGAVAGVHGSVMAGVAIGSAGGVAATRNGVSQRMTA